MIVLRRIKRERWISFGVSSQKKRSRSSLRKKSQTIRKKEGCKPGQTFGYLRVKNVSRFWRSKVSVPQRGFITCNWNWNTTNQPQPWLSSSFVSGVLTTWASMRFASSASWLSSYYLFDHDTSSLWRRLTETPGHSFSGSGNSTRRWSRHFLKTDQM